MVFLGSHLVSWISKKQPIVARSSIESEYRAFANIFFELVWLQSLQFEMGIFLFKRLVIWCDNVSAIYLTTNPIFHVRTKHIEVDYHLSEIK